MRDMLDRTIRALNVGVDVADIHAMLKGAGLSDYDAWLTYVGARMIVEDM